MHGLGSLDYLKRGKKGELGHLGENLGRRALSPATFRGVRGAGFHSSSFARLDSFNMKQKEC